VEHLDLPSQGIPSQLLNRLDPRPDWEVGDQLPADPLSVLRRASFLSVDHGQGEGRMSPLFPNRRQDAEPAPPKLENRLVRIAFPAADLDSVQPLDSHRRHLGRDSVTTVSGQAVVAGPDHEMRSDLLRKAEQLVDVAFSVTNVNTACRITQKLR
jgi:hypothetical protein